MGNRYWITGVQLGMLMGLTESLEVQKLLNQIEEEQYLCEAEDLKQRIEGETAQNTNDLVKTNDLQGNITAQNDIKLARQCMDFKMLRCDNKECLNTSCPLQKSWDK